MDNNSITKELIALEKKYWQAMQNHDLEAALSLTDFPCLVAGPQGARLVDKEEYTELFNSHKDHAMQVKFTNEPEVRLVSENIAVIAYQIHSDMQFQGKEQTMDAVDTSTWIKRNGKWACAHHTETPLQNLPH